MEEIIKQVSYADWQEFRQEVMKRCGLNCQQFRNRCSGRTPASASELLIMKQIIAELNKEK